MLAVIASCGLGLVVGMRHALEPDHLAAVSALVADEPRPHRASLLGALWGVGHSVSLIGAGALLLALRTQMPPRWADGFELFVAVVLIALGIRSLRSIHRSRHSHTHVHLGRLTLARPFAVGIAHGLAGTGAITALALATMPGRAAALIWIAAFAIGSILGMALISGVAGFPLQRLSRAPRAQSALLGAVGGLSLAVGLVWGALAIGRLV
jgi:cytochrome c biogenesis protein CcdA